MAAMNVMKAKKKAAMKAMKKAADKAMKKAADKAMKKAAMKAMKKAAAEWTETEFDWEAAKATEKAEAEAESCHGGRKGILCLGCNAILPWAGAHPSVQEVGECDECFMCP